MEFIKKNKLNIYKYFKLNLLIIILFLLILLFKKNELLINYFKNYNKNDYNQKFVFLSRYNKSTDGLMAYYYINLGCVNDYILSGYIPIIDLISHPNLFNKFNTSVTDNPWEKYFYQPFNYTLDWVKKNAKKIEYADCWRSKNGPHFYIFTNNKKREYWHNLAKKYIPIKDEILKEANFKYKVLFHNSTNVLGILIRGTDYIAKKPSHHSIQPTPEMVFKDISKMEKKYKYKWFFITTEDDLIREKFINEYGKKIKYQYSYKKSK